MVRRGNYSGAYALVILLPLSAACQTTDPAVATPPVHTTVPYSVRVPGDVERLAVLYQNPLDRDEMEAYSHLEGATFQFKELRPSLRIFERSQMSVIIDEQRFQLRGYVSEETAVRVGRVLGVDSVLIYAIKGPSLRDRMFARSHKEIPPYLVTSKIIRVESAEVLFHNVVTASVNDRDGGGRSHFASDFKARPLLRSALDRGVQQTISDLRHAFR